MVCIIGGAFLGITPAWAGKRMALFALVHSIQDHPRVGGEKYPVHVHCHMLVGSPPRGRGKAFRSAVVTVWHGITPAWAGKSISQTSTMKPAQDHPRVGGEKHIANFNDETGTGSPPRGRGKEMFWSRLKRVRRITPAWAGKSHQKPRPQTGYRDHPRVGGEKTKKIP